MLVRPLLRLTLVTVVMLLLVPETHLAQDLHPSRRLSPIGIARDHVGDTYVKITYGRPYVRGREIFGTNTDTTTFLVPFDRIWRTGASEATEITVTGPVNLAGRHLDAGTYSIFTEPGEDEWVFHISPQLGLDGTGIFNAETGEFTPDVYQPSNDLFTFTVPSTTLPEEDLVNQFTISIEEADAGADIVLRWERTEVRVPIEEE